MPEIMPDVSNAWFVSSFVWMYTWKNLALVSNTWFTSSMYKSAISLVESCIAKIPLSSGFLSMLIIMHDWSFTPNVQLFWFVMITAWILWFSLIFCSNSVGISISWILELDNVIDYLWLPVLILEM